MNSVKKLQRKAFLQYKHLRQRMSGIASRRALKHVTFIAGAQRSGTNMVMYTLERNWRTDVFHEHDPRAFDNYIMRERGVIHDLVDRSFSRRVVIKALCESHEVADLLAELSPANAIWMFRHYADKVNSHMVSWPGGRNQIDNLVRDRSSAGWRGLGMTDETYETVCNHYHEKLNDPSALALFWYYRNQLFFDQGFDRDERVHLVNYERFVADPEAELRKIAAFIDIEFDPAMSAMIFGSSVKKRAAPDIEPRVARLCDHMYDRLMACAA